MLTVSLASRVADYQFSLHPPSMIASASLAAALHGLEWTKRSGCVLDELLARLQHITGIEKVSTATVPGRLVAPPLASGIVAPRAEV